ncbi:MAG: hypothetical protein ACRBN8_23340 [Nannocystales bacterium]
MRTFIASTFVAVLGCHSPSSPTADTPDPAPSEVAGPPQETEPEAERPSKCTPLMEPEVAAETFARGQAKIEESRDGEHLRSEPFEHGIDVLEVAAKNGSLKAQSLYGRTLFGARFSKAAPTDEEKDDYVSAIAFLRVAAKAGDEDAVGYLPGLLSEPGQPVEVPLDSLPPGWVAEAFEMADAWIDCHGLPAAG